MKKVVETGLPNFGRPTEHAVISNGHLRTTAVPLKADGSFETGDPASQIDLALQNLKTTMAAAGGTMDDVLQALVFLSSGEHVPELNRLWEKHFSAPYPNRGIILVNGIGVPGVIILIQVHAYIPEPD